MESLCIHIPVDFASRIEFRLLEKQIGRLHAAAIALFLFKTLAYAARSSHRSGTPNSQELNQRVGFLSDTQMELLEEEVRAALTQGGQGARQPGCTSTGQPTIAELLTMPNGFLVRCTAPDTESRVPDGYFCPLFASENRHLSPNHLPVQRQGGIARGVSLNRKRLEVDATKQALLLAPDLFRRSTGEPMDATEVNRVIMLVKLLDNYTGRRNRLSSEFTPGLIQDAYAVLLQHESNEIDRVCVWLRAKQSGGRNHPALPETTEDLLRHFDRVYRAASEVEHFELVG